MIAVSPIGCVCLKPITTIAKTKRKVMLRIDYPWVARTIHDIMKKA